MNIDWQRIAERSREYKKIEDENFSLMDKDIAGWEFFSWSAVEPTAAMDWIMVRLADDSYYFVDDMDRLKFSTQDLLNLPHLLVPIRNEGNLNYHEETRGKAKFFRNYPDISFCCIVPNDKGLTHLARGSDIIDSREDWWDNRYGPGRTRSWFVKRIYWREAELKNVFRKLVDMIENPKRKERFEGKNLNEKCDNAAAQLLKDERGW